MLQNLRDKKKDAAPIGAIFLASFPRKIRKLKNTFQSIFLNKF